MANEIEAFTIALANMDTPWSSSECCASPTPFSPSSAASDESPGEPGRFHLTQGSEIDAVALMQEIQGLINPVPPEGNALIQNVEDMQTQTRLKVTRARAAVEDTIELLAEDLLTGTYWLDLAQSPESGARNFGAAPTAVWIGLSRHSALQRPRAPAPPLGPFTK